MSWDSYTNIKAAIETWAKRSDLNTSGRCDEFIDTIEADLNKRLRTGHQHTATTVTTSQNVKTLSLPLDGSTPVVAEITALYFVDSSGNTRQLRQITPDVALEVYSTGDTGFPRFYTWLGVNLELWPTPDAAYTGSVQYYRTIVALDGTNTTNIVTGFAPELYQYGCMWQAAIFLGKPPEEVAKWKALYEEAGQRFEDHDRDKRLKPGLLATNLPFQPSGVGYDINSDR